MKVKTFYSGLANGFTKAFELLDANVASLGDITIHSLTDTYYPEEADQNRCAHIVRVLVYSQALSAPK